MSIRRKGGSSFPPVLRKLLLWCLAALALLLLLVFIGYGRLLSYLQGESFRDSLQTFIATKTQAKSAEISGTLDIDTNRVSLKGLNVQRPALPQGIEGRNIHAELVRSALLDRELHLTRLMVEEGSLLLDLDSKKKKRAAKAAVEDSFFSDLAPTHARLDRFDCKDFHATLRLGGREFRLTDSALAANPMPAAGKGKSRGPWEFRLTSGRVHTPLPIIGDSSLKSATITLGDKVTTLSDTRLMLSPGELVVNAVRENATGNWSADIRGNSVGVSRLIGEDWKKRLSGVLYGRLRADGHADGLQQAEGRISLQQGVLEGLPFLSNLPVGNTYPYRSLRLEKAAARLSYPHEDRARNISRAWLLDELDLRAEGGWLRVQGHALVDADGSLGGTLLIGLPENIATRLAPLESPLNRSVFNAEGEAGYLWLRLNLSGTLRDPQEDLSVRLMTLLGSALPEAAETLRGLLLPGTEKPSGEGAPEEQKAAPLNPGELIREAGDAAGNLINTGLRSLL